VWIRKEAFNSNLQLKGKEDDMDKELVSAFNNISVSDTDFVKMLSDAKANGVIYSAFTKKVRKIGEKDEKIDPRKKVELSCAA